MTTSSQHPPSSSLEPHGLRAVTEYAAGAGARVDVIEHAPTETAAAEARAAHLPGERMAKTVVVVADGGAPILAVVPADHRVDLDKLRDVLGATTPARLATEREIKQAFPQFEVGAVPPFGPMLVGATVIDHRLLKHREITCAGGDHRHAIRLAVADLVRLADARIGDVCHDWASGGPRFHFSTPPRPGT